MSTRPAPPIPPDYRSGAGMGAAKLPRRGPSEAGKQRLSEIAKARHAAGGFKKGSGGSTKPRKPPKHRVTTMVAEAAREKKNAQAIIDVFKDAVSGNQPIHIRLKAAEAWLRVEVEDSKMFLREIDSETQQRDRAELLELLSEKLTSGHSALLIRKSLEERAGITDAEVIEGEGHLVDTSAENKISGGI